MLQRRRVAAANSSEQHRTAANRAETGVATGRTLEDLDRLELAALAREYLLAGHLIDRAGMPQVIARAGAEVMTAVAIDEWSGASPVYSRRTRRLLGFDGEHDVASMFKGMQLDIGAPPEFLDFRYRVDDERHGGFHLDHCGALADVEPMGDEYVVAMCHHIEDPTFEATVCASNPRARLTPIHRPPRVPADRHPHCAWDVVIDPDIEPAAEPATARRMATTRLAALHIPILPLGDPSAGRMSYAGPVDPDLRLEDFAEPALRALCREFALQGHLLAMSFAAALRGRIEAAEVAEVLRAQLTGVAGVVAGRLARLLPAGGRTTEQRIADVLELHPLMQPRDYVDVWVDGEGETVIALGDCDATEEVVALGWAALLGDGRADSAIDAIVAGVEPGATVELIEAPLGRRRAWRVVLGGEPRPEAAEVTLTRFSSGADFEFRRTGLRSS
jgi:hypothetical protein